LSENPGRIEVSKLMENVNNGLYVIPYFQRPFEWNPRMVCELIESLIQNYYAGLLLLWDLNPTKVKDERWDPIWGAKKANYPKSAILDGQQRLSALYYAFYNPPKKFPKRETYYTFYIDLPKVLNGEIDTSIDYKYTKNYKSWDDIHREWEKWVEKGNLPLNLLSAKDPDDNSKDFIDSNKFQEIMDEFRKKHSLNIRNFNIRDIFVNLRNYKFVYLPISSDRKMYDVCNIFTRINEKGMKLTTFDLLNAFLYPKGIKLRKDLWDNLDNDNLKNVDNKMKEYLLKTISLVKQNYCSSKYLYNLIPGEKIKKRTSAGIVEDILVNDANEFISLWQISCKQSERARKKIMNTGSRDYGAVKKNFIPNTTIIPVLAAIFWNYKDDLDNKDFNALLKDWYWSSVLSEEYSGSSDSVMSEDFRAWMGCIKEGKELDWENRKKKAIQNLNLRETNKGSASYNAILCLLALNGAKDFHKDRNVGSGDFSFENIDDHHIFPSKIKNLEPIKSKMFNQCKNSILNRTLLFNETNQKIQNNPPSVYIKEMITSIFGDEEKVKELLKTHFINEKSYIALKNDNFDKFIEEREKVIVDYIKYELLSS